MPSPFQPNDKLARRAQFQGFRARSVFKLKELDQKFDLFHSGQDVLDLGASPGSWLQYICERISPGRSLGLDLQEINFISDNVKTSVANITDQFSVEKAIAEAGFESFDLVISDLAPNLTGVAHADHVRSIELDKAAFETSKKFLKEGGTLLMKVFPGANLDSFIHELKYNFAHVKLTRSHATRDSSSEMYLICQKKS